MLDRGGVARPLLTDMLNKLAVPGFEYVAALLPIENKLGHCIFNKLRVDTRALQDLQCIAAGLPVSGNGLGFFLSWLKACPFLLSTETASVVLRIDPLIFYKTEEACVPVITV